MRRTEGDEVDRGDAFEVLSVGEHSDGEAGNEPAKRVADEGELSDEKPVSGSELSRLLQDLVHDPGAAEVDAVVRLELLVRLGFVDRKALLRVGCREALLQRFLEVAKMVRGAPQPVG